MAKKTREPSPVQEEMSDAGNDDNSGLAQLEVVQPVRTSSGRLSKATTKLLLLEEGDSGSEQDILPARIASGRRPKATTKLQQLEDELRDLKQRKHNKEGKEKLKKKQSAAEREREQQRQQKKSSGSKQPPAVVQESENDIENENEGEGDDEDESDDGGTSLSTAAVTVQTVVQATNRPPLRRAGDPKPSKHAGSGSSQRPKSSVQDDPEPSECAGTSSSQRPPLRDRDSPDHSQDSRAASRSRALTPFSEPLTPPTSRDTEVPGEIEDEVRKRDAERQARRRDAKRKSDKSSKPSEKETGKRQRQAEREDTGSRSDSESSADDSSSSQQKHENKKRRKSRPSPEEKKKSSLAGMECPTMRAITKAALPAFRGMLVSLSPFPSSDERGELVDDSWVYALHKTKKKRTIDSEARSVIEQRVSQARGALISTARPIVQAHFGLGGAVDATARSSIKERVAMLRTSGRFMFQDTHKKKFFFKNVVIQQVMKNTFFSDKSSIGIEFPKLFNPIRKETLALVLAAVDHVLAELVTGIPVKKEFSEHDSFGRYLSFLKGIDDFHAAAPKALPVILQELYDVCRDSCGVGPIIAATGILSAADMARAAQCYQDDDLDEAAA